MDLLSLIWRPDQDPPGYGITSWHSSSGETAIGIGDIGRQESAGHQWGSKRCLHADSESGARGDSWSLLALPDVCTCPGQHSSGVQHRGDMTSLRCPGLDKGWHQREEGRGVQARQLGPLGPREVSRGSSGLLRGWGRIPK